MMVRLNGTDEYGIKRFKVRKGKVRIGGAWFAPHLALNDIFFFCEGS